MSVTSIHGLPVDVARVLAAIGAVPRVAYEAAHVYPLSAPHFTSSPGLWRERPNGGPLRLYIHIPFCRYACTFCFYAKRVNAPRPQMQRYVDAVQRELEWLGDATGLRQLYVGGGTPTALAPDLLDTVLSAVAARLPLDPTACHTVECSPESLSREHVDVLQRRGVGRVSLGVQTLDERLLDSINRQHSARQALDASALLVDAGFFVNVDLIYGFPGQREEGLRRDLEAVAARGVQSLTLYNLRLNEHTPLAKVVEEVQQLDLPSLLRWRRHVEQVSGDLGYAQTRWHTFLRRGSREPGHDRAPGTNAFGPGREVGIGVSACSHLGETIYRNHDAVDFYMARVEAGESPVEDTFPLSLRDRKTLFVARTLGDGRELDPTDYEHTFARRFEDDFGTVLDRLFDADLVRESAGRLALTDVGRLVHDLVTLAFYPARTRRWLDRRQPARAPDEAPSSHLVPL